MAYIPKEHMQYDVLPYSREHGGEVFEYPAEAVKKISQMVGEQLIPYGYQSYEEYYGKLDSLIEAHAADEEVSKLLKKLKERMFELNQKENWSICRYLGEDLGEIPELGLIHGKCYYWPCESGENAVFRGVIDGEEFTAYQYSTEPDEWEILVDPTGMAYRTIYEGDNHVSRAEQERIMAQIQGTDRSKIQNVQTLGPAPRMNEIMADGTVVLVGWNHKTEAEFLGYFDCNDETMASLTVGMEEMPLNVSVTEDSDELNEGEHCIADIWTDEYEIQRYESEETYKESGNVLAPIGCIPAGTFPLDPDDESFQPNGIVFFTGVVRAFQWVAAREEEDVPHFLCDIETYGFFFRLHYYDEEPKVGDIMHGKLWLYATLKKA